MAGKNVGDYFVLEALRTTKLIPKIKYRLKYRPRNMGNPEGPYGRIKQLRATVTALLKHERIELNYQRADEARGYAERLIMEALTNGDRHQPTMELADFWLEEKQLIHKLFKVLVPRYQNSCESFTALHMLPMGVSATLSEKNTHVYPQALLELKGNPFPSVPTKKEINKNSLTNILVEEAMKEIRYAKVEKQEGQPTPEESFHQTVSSIIQQEKKSPGNLDNGTSHASFSKQNVDSNF
ncbi:mitochondrial ribosomal protein L17 [Tachypleus tridentatus]|uniref:mitochondrial ribosomal protein L17 n=1 Tax=Tachypleus tridentatus TaxID=6853 RepID=UPI003FD17A20